MYCLRLAGRLSFSTRAPVQSLTTANRRRVRILSRSSMWRIRATESGTHLPNGLSKPGERAQDRNFNCCRGWDSNPQPLDRQSNVLPLSYHRSLNHYEPLMCTSFRTLRLNYLLFQHFQTSGIYLKKMIKNGIIMFSFIRDNILLNRILIV